MSSHAATALNRRTFLTSTATLAASIPLAGLAWPACATEIKTFDLRAAPGQVRLVPEPDGRTHVWSYNQSVPGPEIRVRQGQRLRIVVDNGLDEDTTVHWHGVRLPNAMDGVPHLTQAPIAPGESFTYEFDAVDAGTFWYHPHQRSSEQVGRGLYGPLIIEESEPVRVDRDVTWVLDDWRLDRSATIVADFGNGGDSSHGGRIGNTVTINGRVPDSFAVRPGERIRLRLINAANARIFGLDFGGLDPLVIALDAQPVRPHIPEGGNVVLGPAMRADLILDLAGAPGEKLTIVDRFYRDFEYRLVDLVPSGPALREGAPDWPVELAANPIPEPDPGNAVRHEVVFTGGMMGGMIMREMGVSPGMSGGMGRGMGAMMGMMRDGMVWFINGVAANGHDLEPMLTVGQNRSCVLAMTNATAWHHPMHLHGHSFRVISRDGTPTERREWLDTVLIAPRERVEIAFVADNPGDWMFHCHILEHQEAGMSGIIRVADKPQRT